ncbi:flagellar basal body P-ring protein FlgI [Opitutus terrae]|uniref:Flagellar P-ring protein n=1 Tax=Opitutus terrae (strain DSM 11246 / JCM 15787 / PB90-1) TaxID=452637 RepID=B1ZR17_OPITP|nr:flagellar basal body P-ring protein FlgI [Opitutus terrae]ACB73684.1 flagellar P-ring protein [Opitutus terrae PB90-1]
MNPARRTFTKMARSSERWILTAILGLLCSASGHASRVKDLTLVEGGRDNQIVGYGIVAGLAGDGDSNAQATLRSVANILQRYGVVVSPTDIKAKNAAAVMVTADIGPFLKPGSRIDVNVASLGDAKSLQGGVLLQTPLIGGDGKVYAVAQGAVAVGGFLGGAGGAGGATVQKNHPTVGVISNGGIVEREIAATFVRDNQLRLLLHNPDFTSAARMADAINGKWPAMASAVDAATIAVSLPANYAGQDVAFIADLGMIEVVPDTLARVVINERTGTIVATSTVRLSQVAIALGSLTITVSSNMGASQPNAFGAGQTVPLQSTQTNVNEVKGGFTVLNEPPTIERLAAALNALGVSTREMMAIFQSLKRSGALQAELVIN